MTQKEKKRCGCVRKRNDQKSSIPERCLEKSRVWVTEREKLAAKLDPALREWADKVIIPALARQYLAQGVRERIARDVGSVTEFNEFDAKAGFQPR